MKPAMPPLFVSCRSEENAVLLGVIVDSSRDVDRIDISYPLVSAALGLGQNGLFVSQDGVLAFFLLCTFLLGKAVC